MANRMEFQTNSANCRSGTTTVHTNAGSNWGPCFLENGAFQKSSKNLHRKIRFFFAKWFYPLPKKGFSENITFADRIWVYPPSCVCGPPACPKGPHRRPDCVQLGHQRVREGGQVAPRRRGVPPPPRDRSPLFSCRLFLFLRPAPFPIPPSGGSASIFLGAEHRNSKRFCFLLFLRHAPSPRGVGPVPI